MRSYGPNSAPPGPLGPSGVGRVGHFDHFEGPGGPDPMKLGFGRVREGLGGPAVGLAVTVRRGSGSVFATEASFGKLWGRACECRYFQVILRCGCEVMARTVVERALSAPLAWGGFGILTILRAQEAEIL